MSAQMKAGTIVFVQEISKLGLVLAGGGDDVLIASLHSLEAFPRTAADVEIRKGEGLDVPQIVALWNTRRALASNLVAVGSISPEVLSEILDVLDGLEFDEAVESDRVRVSALGSVQGVLGRLQSQETTLWLPVTESLHRSRGEVERRVVRSPVMSTKVNWTPREPLAPEVPDEPDALLLCA